MWLGEMIDAGGVLQCGAIFLPVFYKKCPHTRINNSDKVG